MKNALAALALCAGSTLGLSACVSDGYGPAYGVDVGWGTPYAYDAWYDGYYGPLYDGYWGDDGYFYYRRGDHEHSFHRADRDHVRREAPGQSGSFRAFRGQMRPQQGMQMPHFRGNGPNGRRGH